jgi:hypothetical protein
MPAYKGSKQLGVSPNADATEDSDTMYRARKKLGDMAGVYSGYNGADPNDPYFKEAAARVKEADTLKKLSKDTETKISRAKNKDAPNVVAYAKGGSVSSASKRADGCCTKGKTKGRFV